MPAGKLQLVHRGTGKVKRVRMRRYNRVYTSKTRTIIPPSYARAPMGVGRLRANLPFPNRMPIKCNWVGNIAATTSTTKGLFATDLQYDLNNLNRPNPAITTHAALGFNQLKLIYRKYKIHGCGIKIVLNNPQQDGVVLGMLLAAHGNPETLGGKTVELAYEKQSVKLLRVNNSGDQITKFSTYWPINKVEGITKQQFDANIEDFAALFATTTGPVMKPRLNLALANIQDNNAAEVRVTVHLTFYGFAYDRLTLPLSDPTA